ncbi:MAG: FadR family transcriptional regulator [Alphaproteobacteria bacterium]|nr:FadR family transcriptional regulator [Alphaproteobacteria bacterium]
MKTERVRLNTARDANGNGGDVATLAAERQPPDLTPSGRGSGAIAAHLRRAIMNGVYTSGDQLPPEREIARKFGASRTTIRNALHMLEEQQLISRKIGSGTFVKYVGARGDEEIAEVTSPLELIEVRLALEPHIVRLAVLHGTARDMRAVVEALGELEASEADHEHFSQWDQRFHMAMALATHNPLIVSIYRRINDIRGHAQWNKMKDKILMPARIAEYNVEHRAIFEAVNRRDADAAAQLITSHLMEARQDLLGAQSM